MNNANLNAQILNVLRAAGSPLSAAEIRRALPGLIEPSELSGRLKKLRDRRDIIATTVPRTALTGPKTIKVYSLASAPVQAQLAANERGYQDWNIFQLLPQTL